MVIRPFSPRSNYTPLPPPTPPPGDIWQCMEILLVVIVEGILLVEAMDASKKSTVCKRVLSNPQARIIRPQTSLELKLNNSNKVHRVIA